MTSLMLLLALTPLAQSQNSAPRPTQFKPQATPLHSDKSVARKTSINALGKTGNISAIPYLGSILLNLNEPIEIRVASAMALRRIGNWRALIYLKQSVRDSAKEIRFAATLALGKTKGAGSLALLIDSLEGDPEWWVRFAAASALGENRDPMAVKALGNSAASDMEWQVRMEAVRSLGQIGSREAAYALAKPLRDQDPGVRSEAAVTLGGIGGPESLKLLTSALHDEESGFPRQVMADTVKKLLAHP